MSDWRQDTTRRKTSAWARTAVHQQIQDLAAHRHVQRAARFVGRTSHGLVTKARAIPEGGTDHRQPQQFSHARTTGGRRRQPEPADGGARLWHRENASTLPRSSGCPRCSPAGSFTVVLLLVTVDRSWPSANDPRRAQLSVVEGRECADPRCGVARAPGPLEDRTPWSPLEIPQAMSTCACMAGWGSTMVHPVVPCSKLPFTMFRPTDSISSKPTSTM